MPSPLVPPPIPNPLMPPPNPATTPSMGFGIWAQDPQNAMKVIPSMTEPNRPLQPGANAPQMAAANPPQIQSALTPPSIDGAPPANISLPTPPPSFPSLPPPVVQSGAQAQLGKDSAEAQRLQQTGPGVNQIQNKPLRVLAKIGDIAGSVLAPGVSTFVPGTTMHNEALRSRAQNAIGRDQQAITSQQQGLKSMADLADTQSQTDQRIALANKADQQSDNLAPIALTAEQAASIGHPELAGAELNPKTYSLMLTGKQKADSAAGIAAGNNKSREQIAADRNARLTSLAAEANKTKLLLQDKKDATSRANTSDRIAAGGSKVPADVTKRAALATNTIENASAVNSLIQKRPDMIGAVGGRYTNVQQMIGSDDADIQELGVRIHNIALASNGAHGIRSAEAVADTENKIFNHFRNGPNGIAGGLKGITDSVGTFIQDEQNFQTTGTRDGAGKGNAMVPPATGAPRDGATKKNAAGDTVVFRKGAWGPA
jgi:hypothetical protein